MSNNNEDTDEMKDDEAPDKVDYAIMKNPHVIIIGIADYDAPNNALPAVQDDIYKMKELFKVKFKYPNVAILGEDGGKINKQKLRSFLNDEGCKIQLRKQVDGLILVYSGHGANDGQGENYIVASDNDRLPLTNIQEKFDCEKCDYLKGKPKLLYFDCCRGEEKIEDEEIKQLAKGNAAKKIYINNLSDFMMHYATSQNYISWSNQKKGGHLINAIYKCYINDFKKHENTAITLHETSMKLNQIVSISNKGKQTAEIVNRLTYDVYVKPYKDIDDEQDETPTSRPVLLRMLTDATNKSKDYPALKSKYSELDRKFKELKRKESEYKNKVESYETNEEKMNKKMETMQSTINDNEESNINFEQEINTLSDKNSELEQKVEELEQKVEELEQQNNQLQQQNGQLQQQKSRIQLEMNELKNNTNPSPPPPEPEPQPIPEPDDIPPPEPSIIIDIVDTWKDKDVRRWNCQELQSWLQSLELPNNHGEVEDLLTAIKRTNTDGRQFLRLHNGKAIRNRFVEDGFNIDENTADHVAQQLPRVRTPTVLLSYDDEEYNNQNNQQSFISNKPMEEWSCDELQEWIKTLNISQQYKDLIIHSIMEMECDGESFASMESIQDILDAFDDINRIVARVIFNGIMEQIIK